jgi:uncharacterized protein YbjT (DUF2867 family)/membrane protease YdiL (CAAX protease family)
MKVIVAGASGFIGRHVVAALADAGHGVVALDRGRGPLPKNIQRFACDLTRDDVPPDALDGADAIVNLVGIKRARDAAGFERAHVDVARRLVTAARRAGVRRFVHVSVVCSRPDPTSPYHDTKWRGETLVQASGLDVTILKPAVVYGAGDDMLTHLVKMIRFAPLFPIVGRGDSLLQAVDVRDVACAVVRALARPETAKHSYDVVGPERLRLRDIVRMVASGLDLPLAVVPTPMAVMRPLVSLMSLSPTALSTPSQLRMLEEGLVGDSEPARRDLGLEPRAFRAETVRALAPKIPSLFKMSLRLVSDDADRVWLQSHAKAFRSALAVAITGVLLMPVASVLVSNVWYRMAACGAVLIGLSLAFVRLPWRELWRPSVRGIAQGLAAAAALYGIGAGVFAVLEHVTGASRQIAQLYGWRDSVGRGLVIPLLIAIIAAEEIVWRNAVTLPLAGRLGAWRGSMVAALLFAAAHLSLGVPVLLVAAFGAGLFWSALVVKTRSAVPSLVSHVLWDLAVMFLLPYGGS